MQTSGMKVASYQRIYVKMVFSGCIGIVNESFCESNLATLKFFIHETYLENNSISSCVDVVCH